MKTAIIIHGWTPKEEYFKPSNPAPSNAHWFPWIQRQLLLKEVLVQTPEMPDSYEPNYAKWSKVFEQFEINQETILVGHSCGGGFLLRWLSENDTKVGKVVLVAPWLDPEHLINKDFFDFKIDKNVVTKTDGLAVMYSTDDEEDVLDSIKTIKKEVLSADFQEFNDKGHFTRESMKTEEFPELLENITAK